MASMCMCGFLTLDLSVIARGSLCILYALNIDPITFIHALGDSDLRYSLSSLHQFGTSSY